jgi:3-methyladenine DNA glycosylase AlkD
VPWCRRKRAVFRLLRREQAPALRVCAQIELTDKSKFIIIFAYTWLLYNISLRKARGFLNFFGFGAAGSAFLP